MKTFETKEAFLLDMLEYYTSNVKRRCTLHFVCNYSPVSVGKEGISEGCAIGRYMTPENQLIADTIGNINNVIEEDPTLLPDWMLKFDVKFLSDVQNLHDTEFYWFFRGMTLNGKGKLLEIINENNLDSSLFKNYI